MPDRLTQAGRYLRIATPLGEDKLILRAFTGQEEISRLFRFTLDLVSEDANVNPLDVLGKNVTFSVILADEKTERYFNGMVSRFARVPSTMRHARFQAEVVPKFWFLTRTAGCRIFQEKTVPQIIEQIFGERGLTDYELKIQGQHPTWEYCVQYRETEFDFLSRLMEQEGIFYFFRHENGKHVMVLGDQKGAHTVCEHQPTAEVELTGGPGHFEEEDLVRHWEHHYEFRPGKWAQTDFNFETPKTSLMTNVSTVLPVADASKFEIYDYPGEYKNKGEGDPLTKMRMEEEEVRHEVIEGESSCRGFSPGFFFQLQGHPVGRENQEYVLTAVRHSAHQAGVLGEEDRSDTYYGNGFAAIPKSVTFRPARVTPKPVVKGLQTAIVVGPSGEEIHVDKYGRVKVQFHWDREGKYDDKSSCWIRVSQLWAGKKWGAVYHPRIGQEVVVDFLEGDPDRPLITGRVYNADQMPPYDLPGEGTKSTVKSYSSKGGGGFNEIRFEDKKGKEQIFIHAERQQDVRIKASRFESIGKETHLTVEEKQFELIKQDKHVHVKLDHKEKVDGSVSLKAGMDHDEKVGMKYALDAGTEIHLKAGMTVVIEAGVSLTAKVGGNFININPAGVFIQGTMVMINSGGSAGSGSGASPDAPEDPKEADKADPGEASQAPPPPQPPRVEAFSPAAQVLQQAARQGTPFCEVCARGAGNA